MDAKRQGKSPGALHGGDRLSPQGSQQDPGPILSQTKVREPLTSVAIKKGGEGRKSKGGCGHFLDYRHITRNLNT